MAGAAADVTTGATGVGDFTLEDLGGRPMPLGAWAGRPMLIVNVASLCGFTGQYAGLQRVWAEYEGRGLVVLGVPSNDFGRQEPGDAGAIGAVCHGRFGVGFPIAGKAHVTGAEAIPLFRWLSAQAGALGRPRWNFYKYLVGRDGQLAAWFSSVTTPDSGRLRAAIERALAVR